jgi:thiamine-monophosphate kinase
MSAGVDDASDPVVGDLSEGRILRRILSRFDASDAVVGPGDDAAVIALGGGPVVATVDTLVHGPDFRLAWTSGFDLGWKSAVVNLADVAAMGARPVALLVALAMPDDTRISFVEAVADGLRAACDALAPGCAVEGGDLTVSDTLTVAVTALGALDGPAVRRSGARPGDTVALAGAAGDAARGLAILFDRFRDRDGAPVPVDDGALTPTERAFVAAQLRPRPPLHRGPEAARSGATAMMDVSDGLLLDATRMAEASGVTIALESGALGADPHSALTGGEDHALLATFPAGTLPLGFRAIGRVRERAADAVQVDGAAYEGRGGWDPYRDWDSARG